MKMRRSAAKPSKKPGKPKRASGRLREADVRAIVRLLGEVAAARRDHAGMKRRLMDGLCELVKADAWVWALGCQIEEGKQPVYTKIMHGGFSEERFARYLAAIEHPDMAWLTAPMIAEFDARKAHITRLRQQIDREEKFLNSEAFALWKKADVGPIVLSMRPLENCAVGTVAVYRGAESALFNERESRIAHIVLSEVPWLHEQGWPKDGGATVPHLSPRQRLILNLLLDGRTRKGIAEHLALTGNTVAGYQKTIYRHFSVNSQAGLMRRFQQGDGGDN